MFKAAYTIDEPLFWIRGVSRQALNCKNHTDFQGQGDIDRENYRPISVLPVVSKIHEQFANEQLQSYAREKGLVTKEQFGYLKNSSTIAALLKAVDEWKWAKDKGLIFDVIDHSLLLQKLKANGISGAEHAWFFSYLTNRKQFVQCNGVLKTQMRELSPIESLKDPY